jgi:hypothetical protein
MHNQGMRLLLALLCLALAAPARAWDDGGHKIVDAIAYAHLNPQAKQAVDQLAAQLHASRGAYDAITLGCWMDDIRDDPAVPDVRKFRTWHYIDIPIDLTAPKPPFDPGTDTALHGNAVQGLKRALAVLKGGTDPYIPDKPTALAMIMHLVGDIHQPLHCATSMILVHGRQVDDRGGNLEIVTNGPPGVDNFTLHRFWDQAYRAAFDDSTGNVRIEEFKLDDALLADCDADQRKQGSGSPIWREPNFDLWARASNSIARHVVYPGVANSENPKECRLSSAYVAQARMWSRAQLDAAGQRLATLLNETLGGEIPPPIAPGDW